MDPVQENVIPAIHAKDYILAGKSEVGFYNAANKAQFWFYVKKKNEGIWYVYMGPDTREEDKYIGFIKPHFSGDLRYYRPHNTDSWSPKRKEYSAAFEYGWFHITKKTVPDELLILHKGQCGYCGRELTDAESVIRGIGPVCRKKLGLL